MRPANPVTPIVITDGHRLLPRDSVICRTGRNNTDKTCSAPEVGIMNGYALIQIEAICQSLTQQSCYSLGDVTDDCRPADSRSIDAFAAYLNRRSTPRASRDAAWRRIVEHARKDDHNWTLIAIRLALPGIRRALTRAQCILPEFDRSELETEVVCRFSEAIQIIDVTQSNICSKLCQRVFSALRTFLRTELRNIRTAEQMEFESRIPPKRYGHMDLVLLEAVDEGVITLKEAKIVGATRIEEIELKQIAKEYGIPKIELSLAMKVAEDRLVNWICGKNQDQDR